MIIKNVIFTFFGVFSLFVGCIQASLHYSATEIVPIDSKSKFLEIERAVLNNRGEVMGNGWLSNKFINFLWDSKDGIKLIDHPINEITHFNDAGSLVGFAEKEKKSGDLIPFFLDSNGKFHQIEYISKDGEDYPRAVNNHNQVLFTTSENKFFLWSLQNTKQIVLPKKLATHQVSAIALNDQEQILFLDFMKGSIFVLEADNTVRKIPNEKNYFNVGMALNNLGDVVGCMSYAGSGSKKRDIGMIWLNNGDQILIARTNADVELTAINDQQEAVGQFFGKHESSTLFIWSEKEGIKDLNTLFKSKSNWVLQEALSINNQGQILVRAWDRKTDQEFLILLTPER